MVRAVAVAAVQEERGADQEGGHEGGTGQYRRAGAPGATRGRGGGDDRGVRVPRTGARVGAGRAVRVARPAGCLGGEGRELRRGGGHGRYGRVPGTGFG
ncbi:hypothetical protein ABZ372_41985, partial [Streptomyces sp. NPDC005921]